MTTAAFRMAKREVTPLRRNEDDVLRRLIGAVAHERDRKAFAELFDLAAPRIKSFMMRKGAGAELAEDLVQDTMIAIWTKAGFYDPAKGSAMTWMFTIARNLRIDRLRRGPNAAFIDIADFDGPASDASAEDMLAASQDRECVARALAGIPEDQRQVLILSFVEDVSQSEIAERLKLPLGTVKSRMRLAYGRLRKSLEHLD